MIDIGRIEKCRKAGDGWIGRCPACAEAGADRTGNHLRVWPDGRFACVVNTGAEGRHHRQRIFALLGKPEDRRAQLARMPAVPRVVYVRPARGGGR